ncbi:OmpA family protein [Echinicola salinicaeni]|uniref:OmpA family protein n=1 Tax=Echinicola salinicaeni TaxID=2762757 RepID=UPI00293BD811|nr:OmpA family protein [Echinicola salinicaeni]
MKKNIINLFFLLLLVNSCIGIKNRDLARGNQQYDMMNYAVAVEHYSMAWDVEELPETARGLANSYYHMRVFDLAESWYGKLDRLDELTYGDRLNFAKTLIANSKFDEARRQLNEYKRSGQEGLDIEEASKLLSLINEAKDILNDPKDVQIKNLKEINSKYADFSGIIEGDKLVFASDRMDSMPVNAKVDEYNALRSDIYGWTGNGFLKVYEAKGDWDDFETDSIKNLEKYNSPHHSGPIYEAEDFIFWVKAGKPGKDVDRPSGSRKDFTLFPQIFYMEKVDEEWTDLKSLPFNSPYEYGVSDPFWDEKSKKLYFSSSQPDGSGNSDIYFTKYLGENNWSTPVNLGENVNSSGNERTPYVNEKGELFFSSDGRGGLGGLDVFKSEKSGSTWAKAENMGAPINSSRDDFAFYFNSEIPDRGVLSSDRPGGNGMDDIYAFILEVNSKIFLKGVVMDKETMKPLENAVVELMDKTTGTNFNFVTNEDGEYDFVLGEETVYDIEGKKTDYISAELKGLSTKGLRLFADTTIRKDLYLDKIEIGKTIELENIYYDFDKWDIRDDAALELDKLVKILDDNPTMKIELNSHTDSRGSDSYNQILSEKRAQSAVDYIISRGVSRVRIEAKGYGESRLLNQCDDGVECTDEEHQDNRRTEFTIVDY